MFMRSTVWLIVSLGLTSPLLSACQSGDMPVLSEATGEEASTEGSIVTLQVGPEQVECTGAFPQTCLRVREDGHDDYRLFYDTIEGFEFEAGYYYQLRVRRIPIANPMQDASSVRWVLIELQEKTPA